MDPQKQRNIRRLRRKRHIRRDVSGTAARPRLTVFRSGKHVYGQLIDDEKGVTLVSASTRAKEAREALGEPARASTRKAAAIVGGLLGEKAKAAGISTVVFDRNGYKFHGRVKELAEAARKAGLKF